MPMNSLVRKSMSYILLASCKKPITAQAAAILRNLGHTVVNVNDSGEAWNEIEKRGELPSVFFAHLLLTTLDGGELFSLFHNKYPDANTKLIMAVHIEGGCDPFRNWSLFIDSFIMNNYSAWQLILSIEQLLFRASGKISPETL